MGAGAAGGGGGRNGTGGWPLGGGAGGGGGGGAGRRAFRPAAADQRAVERLQREIVDQRDHPNTHRSAVRGRIAVRDVDLGEQVATLPEEGVGLALTRGVAHRRAV